MLLEVDMAKAKVIQIQAAGDRLYALRDDGTMWVHYAKPEEDKSSSYWVEIPEIMDKDELDEAFR
jgi:hypothetical protein